MLRGRSLLRSVPLAALGLTSVLAASCAGSSSSGSGAGGSITTSGGASGANARGGAAGAETSGGAPSASGGTSTPNGGAANANGGVGTSGGARAASGGSASGGSSQGGASSAGASNGGRAGSSTGGASVGSAGSSSAGTAGTGGSNDPNAVAAITKEGEGQLTTSGLTIVSYGGYLNGESFQQDGVVSYKGYQYAAFWNTNRNVVMARRALPSGAWEKFDFTDYKNSEDDAHNTISLGICPGDGTLHVSFDHHGSDLHYRRSTPGFLDDPSAATWKASSFGAVAKALVGSTTVTQVTYPRFIPEPEGKKMLFEARIGSSGSGDQYLWEYDSTTHAWSSLGKYIDGISDNINAYPHGVSYTRNGHRLHVSWCWRETPDANTNHDLVYVYSDDNGRSWNGNTGAQIGMTGSKAITLASAVPAVRIAQNRGLINQEHMAVDSLGRVHVLLSHMPSSQADDSNFDRSRTKSQFFDYWRDTDGRWHTVALGYSVVANFRGKLAISSSNNVYAILPDLRVAGASSSTNFQAFALLDKSDSGRFFSDPLIDSSRLLSEDKLTVIYPQKSSPNIYALDYAVR
jgi:hypothetical protein